VIFGPHRVLSGGADFALLALRSPDVSLRLGGFGLLELESAGTTDSYLPFPQGDIHYWRGLYGYGVAASFDRLAADWLGPRGALEATVTVRHESEHETGSSSGGPGTDYSDVPIVGNFVMLDLAARVPLADFDVVVRVQDKQFIPSTGSGYAQGPGADLIVRWRKYPRLQPFSSTFAEYLFGTDGYPDAYLVRNLTGVVVPSAAGDLYVFLDLDVGNRKGLAVYTVERSAGFGLRFAFF
jgi:hypothetical protein